MSKDDIKNRLDNSDIPHVVAVEEAQIGWEKSSFVELCTRFGFLMGSFLVIGFFVVILLIAIIGIWAGLNAENFRQIK